MDSKENEETIFLIFPCLNGWHLAVPERVSNMPVVSSLSR